MTNFIPIFPLGIVVFPGETLNLHIFEPRYKQLINECFQTKKPFGIPCVLDGKVSEIGTLIEVVEISASYDNGEMDIKTKGDSLFRILEIIKEIPDKLYSGAIASHIDNQLEGRINIMPKIMVGIRRLHKLLEINKDFLKTEEELTSYDVAHHAGMTLEQEYEMLSLFAEDQRQEYLRRHLVNVVPNMVEMETLKERVKLNGHFKHLEGMNFE
jgi:uncharacterized protein